MGQTNLDPFTRAYIDAALWSSTAYGSEEEEEKDPANEKGDRQGTFDASFLDCGFTHADLSAELLAQVVRDCEAFQKDNEADLRAAWDLYPTGREWTPSEYAGHDFWLTRNGHGAGFWDRGLGDVGQRLTDAAHAYGEESWYLDRETDPEEPTIRA